MTLVDNFEWVEGDGSRLGNVHVDFESQKWIPKDSAYEYKAIMKPTVRACKALMEHAHDKKEIVLYFLVGRDIALPYDKEY